MDLSVIVLSPSSSSLPGDSQPRRLTRYPLALVVDNVGSERPRDVLVARLVLGRLGPRTRRVLVLDRLGHVRLLALHARRVCARRIASRQVPCARRLRARRVSCRSVLSVLCPSPGSAALRSKTRWRKLKWTLDKVAAACPFPVCACSCHAASRCCDPVRKRARVSRCISVQRPGACARPGLS